MKKIWIIITIILIICVGIFTINVFNSKDNKVIKDDLGNTLAIMISNENGIGYKDYEKSIWPSKEYRFKEAKCYDMNGNSVENVVTFNEETRKAKITTNQTISCTLYFDKPIITYLRSNDSNGILSQEEVGGMYRYQGVGVEEAADETHKYVDNNYICFGTKDESKCNCDTEDNCDKYMYRIIGITADDELYLIKMKVIDDGNTKTFQLNSKYLIDDCVNNACEWANVELYKRINGEASQINMSNIFINSERYDYLKDGNPWYEKIDYHNWLYGDINHMANKELNGETVYGAFNNGLIVYEIETGLKPTQHFEYINNEWKMVKHQWSQDKKVKAKIRLMYIHDDTLAYDNIIGGLWTDNPNNWINLKNSTNTTSSEREWLLTNLGKVSDSANYLHHYMVYSEGRIDTTEPSWLARVRPTFYLVNTIQLSGKGTIDNPYIIN